MATINWALLPNQGIFIFSRHSYGAHYVALFTVLMFLAGYVITARRRGFKSMSSCVFLGLILGSAISIISLFVAFALAGNANGIVESLRSFQNSVPNWSVGSWARMMLMSLASCGWLYGAVLMIFGRIRMDSFSTRGLGSSA